MQTLMSCVFGIIEPPTIRVTRCTVKRSVYRCIFELELGISSSAVSKKLFEVSFVICCTSSFVYPAWYSRWPIRRALEYRMKAGLHTAVVILSCL
jgi:hypothetical protein